MLRPMQDYIVVKPIERVKSSVVEVVLDEKPNTGEVMAVGPGKEDARGRVAPMDIKVGDLIRFGTTGKTKKDEYLSYPEIVLHGQQYLVMQESDVCFVEESDAT